MTSLKTTTLSPFTAPWSSQKSSIKTTGQRRLNVVWVIAIDGMKPLRKRHPPEWGDASANDCFEEAPAEFYHEILSQPPCVSEHEVCYKWSSDNHARFPCSGPGPQQFPCWHIRVPRSRARRFRVWKGFRCACRMGLAG